MIEYFKITPIKRMGGKFCCMGPDYSKSHDMYIVYYRTACHACRPDKPQRAHSIEGTCGNGLRDDGEACDDGNTLNHDGCNSACEEEKGYSCSRSLAGVSHDFCQKKRRPIMNVDELPQEFSDIRGAGHVPRTTKRAHRHLLSSSLPPTFSALDSSDHSISICGSLNRNNNSALYGHCVASEYKSIIVDGAPDTTTPAYSGAVFTLQVQKIDAYNQTMTSDSSSGLTVSTSYSGQLVADPSINLAGQAFAQLNNGRATFEISVAPSFTEISAPAGVTTILRQPSVYFQGTDEISGHTMRSKIKKIVLHTGSSVCPSGHILSLAESVQDARLGTCTFCRPGTYSVKPLAGPTSSDRFVILIIMLKFVSLMFMFKIIFVFVRVHMRILIRMPILILKGTLMFISVLMLTLIPIRNFLLRLIRNRLDMLILEIMLIIYSSAKSC